MPRPIRPEPGYRTPTAIRILYKALRNLARAVWQDIWKGPNPKWEFYG